MRDPSNVNGHSRLDFAIMRIANLDQGQWSMMVILWKSHPLPQSQHCRLICQNGYIVSVVLWGCILKDKVWVEHAIPGK